MNDLQKLLALRGISVRQIATATGRNYHSVQKCIKGLKSRTPAALRTAVAGYLGLDEGLLWGDETMLRQLIAQEIDRKAAGERARLRALFLHQGAASVTNRKRVSNA